MKILVEHATGTKRDELEIDPLDTVEILRLQIYSLTGVPPMEQQITGLASSAPPLSDMLQIKQLALQEGQRLIVTAKLTEAKAQAAAMAPSAAQAAQTAAPAAAPAPTTAAAPSPAPTPRLKPQPFVSLDGCCSRSFFGKEALVQPSAFVGSTAVCYACAATCHLPTELKPRVSVAPFVCGCADIAGRECIFGVRAVAAADLLTGGVAQQVRATIAAASAKINEQALAQGKQQMQARIGSHIRAVLEYEQPDWQAAALRVIPVATLEERARKAREPDGDSTALAPRDALMWQLLKWFKFEFFTWVNQPPCERCNGGTTGIGACAPNAAEIPFRPGVVELYRCSSASCGATTRFPRFNHAVKLLETRRGRCGEFAQAFTLCCRALGFEARSANDWTDHVWTEYFSADEGRWIHADPCEARRDAPLLYEGGWGKKLTYVIACSKDEVVDVTRRYTKRWSEVLDRRTSCPEGWLNMYCQSLTQMKALMTPRERQEELARRRQREEAEFAANEAEEKAAKAAAAAAAEEAARQAASAGSASAAAAASSAAAAAAASAASSSVKEEEKQGRTTGSVEWRAARGELGSDAVAVARALNPDQCVPGPAAAADGRSAAAKALCSTEQPSVADAAAKVQQLSLSGGAAPAASATASSPAAPSSAADQLAQAKARTAALFKQYVVQLTRGCEGSGCDAAHCRSNASFTPPAPADVPKAALELTKSGVDKLCPRIAKAAATAPSS